MTGSFLNKVIEDTQSKIFIEPFCGSCWITQEITGSIKRIACDAHPDLILMWQSLRNGWVPPTTVTEKDYKSYRHKPPSPTRGFVGFGASFGGKWFGGYARDGKAMSRNYALGSRNSLIKKMERLQGVQFVSSSFEQIPVESIENALIYCDPPYANTTGYKGVQFDSERFWEWVRSASQRNHVFVSEYIAPRDFRCVLSIATTTDLAGSGGIKHPRIERLFRTENETD